MFKDSVIDRIIDEFGKPVRKTVKVIAWDVGRHLSIVVQIDQPNKEDKAFVWLPYPPDAELLPEIALEYPAESGRHSNTYPSKGLGRGKPALKLVVSSRLELDGLITYIKAFKLFLPLPLPEVKTNPNAVGENVSVSSDQFIQIDVSKMPIPEPKKPRREAIPRSIQREVWQRDAGMCVECESRARLCFDHIVPFSKGGSNTVRNLQLLCESCNLSKGNRI